MPIPWKFDVNSEVASRSDVVADHLCYRRCCAPRIRDHTVPLRWVSFIHLFISFMWQVGPIAIAKREGRWVVERGIRAQLANGSD